MTALPSSRASAGLSLASGAAVALASPEPRSLVERVAERVAARPEGVIRSHCGDGAHRTRSRGALWRDAGDVAAALHAAGAVTGSFVVVLADDILDFLPAAWGCLRGGFVPVALMGAAREAIQRGNGAFGKLLALLGTPAIVADDHFAACLARMPGLAEGVVVPLASVAPAAWGDHHPVTPDPAWLVATSGSTGQPKLAALSPGALLFRKFAGQFEAGVPLPSGLGTFPLDGMTGQDAAFLHHDSYTQVSLGLMTARRGAILDAIEEHGIAEVVLATSMIRGILAAEAGSGRARRLGCLRLVALGAEPIQAGVVQEFARLLERHGVDPGVFVAGYGTTETGALVGGSRALLAGERQQPVCLGRPWHGVAMRVVDKGGAVLPEGETGELEVSCPAKMFSGYWGEPELTAAAFTADGWWRTGDLGRLAGGELFLSGRGKDVLIVNGRKLSLADLDAEVGTALGVNGVGHAYRMLGPAAGNEAGEEALGIAFDAGDGTTAAEAGAAVAAAVVRRFGIQPRQVTVVPADQVPRTAAGKVRRGRLAELAAATAAPARPDPTPAPDAQADTQDLAGRLGAIWRDVLGLGRDARPEDRFFDLAGDSLRAVTLDLQVREAFGVRVPGEAFFAAPSFDTLLRLVRHGLEAGSAASPAGPAEAAAVWLLPPALHQGLSSALSTWRGERRGGAAMIAGHHTGGSAPPLFWVFNGPEEANSLADALGPQQPLYATRSGYGLMDYREDEVQLLALRYVSEIVRLRPSGPVFVGGNCQGGIIALAVAHHLLRRGRHVPLLVLMDWSYQLQPFPGRVLMVGGARNLHLNPRHLFARPEAAWARFFAAHSFAEISGGYSEGFLPPHVGVLARALGDHMRAALLAPPLLIPASGYRAAVEADGVPARLAVGERRTVRVSVTNGSDVAWAPTPASGLVLGSRWLRPDGEFQGPPQPRAVLPGLGPGATATVRLRIVAPAMAGNFTLTLDLVDEGNRWFGLDDTGWFKAAVNVSARDRIWARLRRPVHTP